MGTGIWISGQAEPFKAGLITKEDLFACREDVTKLLAKGGLETPVAFKLVEKLRKGKPLSNDEIKLIYSTNLKQIVKDNIMKIKYLFPSAHAVSYAKSAMQIMWYKQYQPAAFYCTLLTQYGSDVSEFNYEEVFNCETLDELKIIKKQYSIGQNQQVAIKFKTRLADLIFEAKLRGFELKPANLYSHHCLFSTEPNHPNVIYMPLTSISGVAGTTAKKIYDSFKETPYTSYEELLERKDEANRKIFNKRALEGLGLYELNDLAIEKLNYYMNELNRK